MTGLAPSFNLVVEERASDALLVKLSGDSREQSEPLDIEVVREALDHATGTKVLSFESAGVIGWDSRFVAFIRNCLELPTAMAAGLPRGETPVRARLVWPLVNDWVPSEAAIRHCAMSELTAEFSHELRRSLSGSVKTGAISH